MIPHSQRAIFDNDVTATGVAILFCGVFVGGYILKLLLEYLGFKNDGDMAIPVIIYVICLMVLLVVVGQLHQQQDAEEMRR
ncbi:MAG: hypothetical protein EHJ95_06155 [Methanobacteriota archaeon]|nr:MAG: hypothetical protein EHJ95_06155 [Euryarchaeota archaeon]